MILLIDNYDSFVHNLGRYLCRLGQATKVVRNDAITCEDIDRLQPAAIVLSPGPCTPTEAGVCVEVVRRFAGQIPMLGVCLGHQVIAAAFGADVVRCREPMHGRTSLVYHDEDVLWKGIGSPFRAARYHSLIVSTKHLPHQIHPIAWTADGLIMGLRHLTNPVWGVQFHPESVLTECGYRLLANFLRAAGLDVPARVDGLFADELAERSQVTGRSRPITPVPF